MSREVSRVRQVDDTLISDWAGTMDECTRPEQRPRPSTEAVSSASLAHFSTTITICMAGGSQDSKYS